MHGVDLKEAMALTVQVLQGLSSANSAGLPGANLSAACGALIANGSTELAAGGYQFWTDFIGCFEAAPPAGATFESMDTIRVLAEGFAPVGLPAIAVKNLAIRMALAEQARILAATVFVSRQQITGYMERMQAAFSIAELVAADNLDNSAYTALITIHAAVANDLSIRSFTLPQVVSYSFGTRLPSLTIAQRLYSDPTRNDELVAENKPIHPLFMPATGEALSA